MADPEHLQLVRSGVKAWNQWRNDNPVIRPDLGRADLHGAALSGAALSGAALSGADLHEAALSGAKLIGADLSVADLHGAYLIGANLIGANLIGADLHGADLGRADLGRADLGEANLSEANLHGADLHGADLGRADLIGANLSGAKLIGADLSGANLSGADLIAANLIGAHLSGAKLIGAHFSEAAFGATNFADVDLSQVQGLETCKHSQPSSIGIDTVVKSGGNIPEVFLRGCGVPEPFIVQMKALISAMSPIQFYSCFISYSHNDKAFARRLYDSLQGRGIRCWLDERQLLPGDDIYEHVDRGIRLWDKVLLCCSENSLTSWWVDDEIGKAFAKEQDLMKERKQKVLSLIPLDLDGYLFTGWTNGKATQVRQRLAADFREWKSDHEKCEEQIENVILALRADAQAREAPPASLL